MRTVLVVANTLVAISFAAWGLNHTCPTDRRETAFVTKTELSLWLLVLDFAVDLYLVELQRDGIDPTHLSYPRRHFLHLVPQYATSVPGITYTDKLCQYRGSRTLKSCVSTGMH